VQRTDASGNTTTYVYDAFGSLAAEYNGTQAATGTQYVTMDHLGSTRLVMGSTGNERHDYLPFGYDLGQSAGTWRAGSGLGYGADTVRQKFTGQERDQESAPLDYFNARYYSLAQGRFASVDPGNAGANLMDPQSWNGYGYVSNNPLRFTDPSGKGIFGDIGSMIGSFFPGLGTLIGWGIGSIADVATGQSISPPGFDIGGAIFGSIAGSVNNGQPWNEQFPGLHSLTLSDAIWGPQRNPMIMDATGNGNSVDARINCAARFGDNHSIAAAFHAQNTFIGQFLGGNTFSGLADIYLNVKGYSAPTSSDLAQIALGGAGQGIPMPEKPGIQTLFTQAEKIGSHSAGWDGAAGIAVDKLVGSTTGLAAKALPAKAVGAIGRLGLDAVNVVAYGQLALDFGTFAYGYVFACH
jgi:RHS repeat-associated protein